jgi:hypothetical protein
MIFERTHRDNGFSGTIGGMGILAGGAYKAVVGETSGWCRLTLDFPRDASSLLD